MLSIIKFAERPKFLGKSLSSKIGSVIKTRVKPHQGRAIHLVINWETSKRNNRDDWSLLARVDWNSF